jgi:hypothetical protein
VIWEDSWETFFAKSMRQALDLEIEKKGPSQELEILSEALFSKVIPRLLRPLERDGRTAKPSLVHGDLWYANSGNDVNTGLPLIFDACCFFAHNECTSRPIIKSDAADPEWTNTSKKTSSGNGGLHVIGSGPNTSLHTTLSSRFRLLKRTLKAALICIGCKAQNEYTLSESC